MYDPINTLNSRATQISSNISIQEKCPSVDFRYGPYGSLEEAFNAIPKYYRAVGLTVGIINENGEINEYWFKSAADSPEDFVLKGGGGPGEVTVVNTLPEPSEDNDSEEIATINGNPIYVHRSNPLNVVVDLGPIPAPKDEDAYKSSVKVGKIGDTTLYSPLVTPLILNGTAIGKYLNGEGTNTVTYIYSPNISYSTTNNISQLRYGPVSYNAANEPLYTTLFTLDKGAGTITIDGSTFAFTKSSSNCYYMTGAHTLPEERDKYFVTPEMIAGGTAISIENIVNVGIPGGNYLTLTVAIPCDKTLNSVVDSSNNNIDETGNFEYKGIVYYLGTPYLIYVSFGDTYFLGNNFKFTFK